MQWLLSLRHAPSAADAARPALFPFFLARRAAWAAAAGLALGTGGVGCVAPARADDSAYASGQLLVTLKFPAPEQPPRWKLDFGKEIEDQKPGERRHGSGKVIERGRIQDQDPKDSAIGLYLGESRVSSGPGPGFAEVTADGKTREVTVTNGTRGEMVFTLSGTYETRLEAQAEGNGRAEAVASFSIFQDGKAIFTLPSPSQPPLRVVDNGTLTIGDGTFTTGDIRLAGNASSKFRILGNLRVTASTVPEPSAVAFAMVFGLGGLGLVARGRHRQRLPAVAPGA